MQPEKYIAQILVDAGLETTLITKIILRIFANPLAIRYVQLGKVVEALHVAGVRIAPATVASLRDFAASYSHFLGDQHE